LSQGKYLKEKFKKVKGAVKRKIFNLTNSTGNDSSGEGEMIAQLKEKFHITGKKSAMVQMLMVFLKRWLIRNIQQDFKVPNYIVSTLKKLVAAKGIFSNPNVKAGKILTAVTASVVKHFSRFTPGTKDYISVNS
jgi:hypothetical protein